MPLLRDSRPCPNFWVERQGLVEIAIATSFLFCWLFDENGGGGGVRLRKPTPPEFQNVTTSNGGYSSSIRL
jgi:hypothetical protein